MLIYQVFCGSLIRAILQEVPMNLIHNVFRDNGFKIIDMFPRGQWGNLGKIDGKAVPLIIFLSYFILLNCILLLLIMIGSGLTSKLMMNINCYWRLIGLLC